MSTSLCLYTSNNISAVYKEQMISIDKQKINSKLKILNTKKFKFKFPQKKFFLRFVTLTIFFCSKISSETCAEFMYVCIFLKL